MPGAGIGLGGDPGALGSLLLLTPCERPQPSPRHRRKSRCVRTRGQSQSLPCTGSTVAQPAAHAGSSPVTLRKLILTSGPEEFALCFPQRPPGSPGAGLMRGQVQMRTPRPAPGGTTCQPLH